MGPTMPTHTQLTKRADDNGLAVRMNPSRNRDAFDYGLYAVIDLEFGGTTHACPTQGPYALTLGGVVEELIPTGINQNPWAHFRRPIDMIFQG